jgi:hypothetical protein
MGISQRKTPSRRAGGKEKSRTRIALPNVQLEKKPSTIASHLTDYPLWLHGFPGVGKTSFAAQAPGAYHLLTQPAPGLKIRRSMVKNWGEFLAYLTLCLEDDTVKTIVVDVLEDVYRFCLEYVCENILNIDHPGVAGDHGRAWNVITQTLLKHLQVALAIKPCIFISSSDEKEIQAGVLTPARTLIRPTLVPSAAKDLQGKVSIVAFLDVDADGERWFQIQPTFNVTAKNRIDDHFLLPDGKKILRFWAGNSPRESRKRFRLAFLNKLTETTCEPT